MDEEFHIDEGQPKEAMETAETQPPSASYGAQVNRRQALAGLFALGALGVVGAGKTGNAAEKKTPLLAAATGKKEKISPEEALDAAEKSVQEAGYLTVERDFDPNNVNEKALRAPSVMQPLSKCNLISVCISTTVKTNGGGRILLPCPSGFGDQLPIGSQSMIEVNGQQIPCDAEIIYSQSPNTGHRNAFMENRLGSDVKGHVKVINTHWLTHPLYQPFTELQLANILGKQTHGALKEALMAAANLPYAPSINRTVPGAAHVHKKGDCTVKAELACEKFAELRGKGQAGGASVGYVEGYTFDPAIDSKFGGRHAMNMATSSKGQILIFDPRTNTNWYMGPQYKFIPTGVGGDYVLPNWNRGQIMKGAVDGWYDGTTENDTASFSLLHIKPPKEITEYAALRWAENMKKYRAPSRK